MSNFVETLYYLVLNSTLLGDTSNAKMYLHFLREEFDNNEILFESLKKDHRWKHLVELGNAIDNNLVFSKSLDCSEAKSFPRQEEETLFSKQEDLVKAIMLSQDNLRMCLGAESDFHCSCTELETRFGRVDLVAQDKITAYPIEVKKSGAYHDVVGQIDKYVIQFKLWLINRMYENVLGVVIANSFDSYTIKELYKAGVVPVKYKFRSQQSVEFERL